MVKPVSEMIKEVLSEIQLSILVFGPQVASLSADNTRTRHLQDKRIEVRRELEALGHHVKYAEDLVDPDLGNAFFQELVIMREYDLIIVIVDSPGSISEATAIAMKPQLAVKTTLFMDQSYQGGLVDEACKNAEEMGAYYQTYEYPKDLVECHLLGYTLERVTSIQKMKYLL